MVLSEQPRRRFRYRRYFCRWLATFSRVSPSTFMSCMMVLGTAFFTPRCVTASTKRLCSAGVQTSRGRFKACASSSPPKEYIEAPIGAPPWAWVWACAWAWACAPWLKSGSPPGCETSPRGAPGRVTPPAAPGASPAPIPGSPTSRARLNASNVRLRSTPYWNAII